MWLLPVYLREIPHSGRETRPTSGIVYTDLRKSDIADDETWGSVAFMAEATVMTQTREPRKQGQRPRIGPWFVVVGLLVAYFGVTLAFSNETSCNNDFGGVFEPSARFILAGQPLDMYTVVAGGDNPFYPNATGPVGEYLMAGALYTGRALHLQDVPALCRHTDGYPLPADSIPLHMWVIMLFALAPLGIGIEIMHLLDRYQPQPLTSWQRGLGWLLILLTPPMWDSLIFYGHYEQVCAIYFGMLAVRFFAERPAPGEQQRLPIWLKMVVSGVLLGLALLCRTSASFFVIPLALALLFELFRDRAHFWRRLGEALCWGVALTATTVGILLPFYVHSRYFVVFSLFTFRARLGIGDGSFWTFAVGTPYESQVQSLDSTVAIALAIVLSAAALLLGRVRATNDPAIYAIICISSICFALSIKAVWGYYFTDPIIWGLAWSATRLKLRQRWWEPIIISTFFSLMMLITEYRITIAQPGSVETGWTRTLVLAESGTEFLGLFLCQILLITALALRKPADIPVAHSGFSAANAGNEAAMPMNVSQGTLQAHDLLV